MLIYINPCEIMTSMSVGLVWYVGKLSADFPGALVESLNHNLCSWLILYFRLCFSWGLLRLFYQYFSGLSDISSAGQVFSLRIWIHFSHLGISDWWFQYPFWMSVISWIWFYFLCWVIWIWNQEFCTLKYELHVRILKDSHII